MKLAESFIPTAGSAGLLPMVTYFFLVVAMLAFPGIAIVALTIGRSQSVPLTIRHRLMPVFIAVNAAIAGLVYYLIQAYYHDLLAELPAVSDAADRQTLIRESYNAIGQYRYMAWFITTPLLLVQVIATLNLQWQFSKRLLAGLFAAALFMVFTSYIGHQQLAFDNEIQPGPKLVWGGISTLAYGYIAFTLYRLWKTLNPAQWLFRTTAGLFTGAWVIYFLGYFGTLLPIDFDWIHLVYTLTDLISQLSIGLLGYLTWSKPQA